MFRSILVILLVFMIPFGAWAHEGMIALVADPAMLDCDDGIETGTIVNIGARVGTGVYFYTLEYKKESISRKMVLLR